MKKKKPAPRPGHGQLSHRSYTGKRLPKENTSYPFLLFILLLLGVFMLGLSLSVSAADVSVTAVSDGPPPPAPAIITSPTEGSRFSSTPITVSGSCPARFMVKLYRNNVFSGATLCALDDTFQIQTDLFEGANDLQARIFNAVDEEGPTSPVIRVYYDKPPAPPAPSSPTSSSEPGSSTGTTPLIIKADNLYKGYFVGDEINWPLDIIGGNAPYALSIDWGDGNTSIFSRKQSGAFSIHHVYAAPGPNQDSYTIKLTASDSNDTKTYLQLMVIIHDKNNVALASPGSTSSSGLPSLQMFWPIYGVTLLMAVSFWLGERRQFLRLKPQLRAHK